MAMKVIDTKITIEWGVEWSPFEIVRDFLQNFYDDNPVNDIKTLIQNDSVIVNAPKEFNPELLDYLVSFKGEDKIGKYGEGFKAATLNALRDHGCRIFMEVSGERREWFLEEKRFGSKSTKVVMCRIDPLGKTAGTKLIIKECPQVLIDEFRRGLTFFYYLENPLFGEELASSYEKDIFAYRSIDNRGYVFYHKLLRAVLDAPIVLVCNRDYKTIEEKIKYDRDRKAFNEKVLESLLNLTMKNLSNRSKSIIELLEPWWSRGHKILAALASGSYVSQIQFPENYYARSETRWVKNDIITRIKNVEDEFRLKGYIHCPGYMTKFGMKSARSVIETKDAELKKLHSKIHLHNPNEIENRGLEILKSFIKTVYPPLADNYENAKYIIGSSDQLLGELREKRGWQSREVYLSEKIFSFSFGVAVSVLLHEWAHIYGFDGSRNFTDALTEAIAIFIDEKDKINKFKQEWEKLRLEIKMNEDKMGRNIYDYIEQMTNKQKTKLLRNLPEEELMRLLSDAKLDEPEDPNSDV